MPVRTAILALTLCAGMIISSVGMGYGDERQAPAVDMQEATRIVLTEFPNARILEMELDTEDGRLVYEVELITAEGHKKEMQVNATTGRIEKIKHD